MKYSRLAQIIIASLLPAAASDTVANQRVMENTRLKITLDDQDGSFTVHDKKTSTDWVPYKGGGKLKASKVETVTGDEKSITLELDAKHRPRARITFGADPAQVAITIESRDADKMSGGNLGYPVPLTLKSNQGYLIQPTVTEGMAYPLAEVEKEAASPFRFGKSMPWYGVTDMRNSYMAILETFSDRSSDSCAFPAQVLLQFFDNSDYVTMAKYYRQWVQAHHPLPTFKEKSAKNPDLQKFLGAVEIYVWGDARSADMAREFKAAGIDRAMIMWDPNHAEEFRPADIRAINEMGFLGGNYDTVNQLWDLWSPGERVSSESGGIAPHDRRVFLGRFPDYALVGADGKLAPFGKGPGRYVTCSIKQLEWAKLRLDVELQRYPYKSRFFDTAIVQTKPCHSPDHPCTLEESRDARIKIFDYTRSKGLLVGSGEGLSADWSFPHLDFVEGAMTVRSRGHNFKEEEKTRDSDGKGDFSNPYEPSKIFQQGPYGGFDKMVALHHKYRLPLLELVYHDVVVTTWFWRDTNHRDPEMWQTKDLWNILYGNMPMWQIVPRVWEADKKRFAESFKQVSTWMRQVGFDEMTYHKWLTDDHSVQETGFSSGRSVIVNFGDKPYAAGGVKILPKSYHFFQKKHVQVNGGGDLDLAPGRRRSYSRG